MTNYPVLSFNSGELSPQIDARSDVDKYRSGCRILENMIPRIYGPAERRPGTKYIASLTYPGSAGRVIPFIYSSTIAYIVLLEDQQMRFYYDGAEVTTAEGGAYSLSTPYLEADLFELQFKQSNDVMWITHPDYAPRKLTRTTANSFALTAITFTNGPFKARNDLAVEDGITMTPSAVTGSSKTLTASSAFFDSTHVGALFKLTHARAATYTGGNISGTGQIGDDILVEGDFSFNTYGVWTGTVELRRSADAGVTWETYRTYGSRDDRNVQYTGTEEEDDILYRIYVTAYTNGPVNADITVNSSTQDGICQVTAYTSSTVVTITILKDFGQTAATARWFEGCWSPYRGYPTCVTFFEGRCIYAATPHQPQTIWFSAVDDFEDFDECTKDDAAFSLTMSSDTRNAIRWITPLEALLQGTTGGEWRVRSSAYDEPVTPTNYSMKQQTSYGSAPIQALPVNDVILFVDYVRRKVREMSYDGDTYKYVCPDLTALAEHITEEGITSIAYQRNPDPILWCTLTDGTLLSMVYEREQNVVAWSKHYLAPAIDDATIESLESPTNYPTLQTTTTQDDPGLSHTTAISTATELQNMTNDKAGNYYLTADIDVGATIANFVPVGTLVAPFTGTLDGNGYTISNLVIDRGTQTAYVGLFGLLSGAAKIANVTLTDCDITGGSYTGALVGSTSHAGSTDILIQNCSSSGTITAGSGGGGNYVGGLVGFAGASPDADAVRIYDSSSTCAITSYGYDTGGFVGGFSEGLVQNCYATGSITKGTNGNYAGGFVGSIYNNATVRFCYATGDVAGRNEVGGFVGRTGTSGSGILVERCYATGDAEGSTTDVGGFVGFKRSASTFQNVYAWGNATGTDDVGGFAGEGANILTNAYSIGAATGAGDNGGLVGAGGGTGTALFWDTEASGNDTSDGDFDEVGHVTTWMKTRSNYEDAGWDFDTIWTMGSITTPASLANGGVESVAVIPSTDEDEVWITTARYINDSLVRFVEQFQPRNFGDQEDAWFVDCGLDYDSTAASTFSGLSHLEGETVAILGDGAAMPAETVSSGAITLDESVSRCIVGLPFRYKLKPMRFDLTTAVGTTKGSIKRIHEVVISLYKSLCVEYGTDEDNTYEIKFRTDEAYGYPPELYTGDKVVVSDSGFDVEDSIIITGDSPLPCTIRAIIPRIEITGR